MKKISILFIGFATAISLSAQSTAIRVIHNDPSKYRALSAVHAGAGKMGFTELIGRQALATNFLYLHAGVIDPKSGIGHHFHHSIEEMYVLLSGEAEFTINGHTSKLKAPAIVPCKLGDAHAIYNATSQPVKWLNFGVSLVKGRAENFDLGDTRVGANLEPIPVFVSTQLKREALRADNNLYPGNGALYHRELTSDIFGTNWDHVDHVVIPAGGSAGPRRLDGVDEVYYVMNGSGTININGDSTTAKADDAFAVQLGETARIANRGTTDLELLVIGVAMSKNKGGEGTTRPASTRAMKAMALQMDFTVTPENSEAFEKMYSTVYVPAMRVQQGYVSSQLLRMYSPNVEKQIEGEASDYNYQIQISFDTEENRRKWVASDEHKKVAWPSATKLAKAYKWRGFDVMGIDQQR